ncbi:MAG: hypothetical protein K6C94_02730 [Candidatus Gastranaerophilales bacterium]|nr:hypothetical protein [Candidatus Gastranaerophilales bacterium]
MNKETLKLKLLQNCLEKKLSRFEADKVLISHGFEKLQNGEADCYDVMINGTKSLSNPRERVIASSLIKGLSRTEANIALYDAKFRRLSARESADYEDVLSRIRYCGQTFDLSKLKEEQKAAPKISSDDIIKNGIANEQQVEEVNQELIKNGYNELSNQEVLEYRRRYNEYHNQRQSLIQHAFEDLKTVAEINAILQKNNFSVLTMVEEFKYLKEKDRITSKKRDNLIKECLEEQLETFEIDIILSKNNYEKLSEQEIDDIKKLKLGGKRDHKKTTELSDQFRTLYRKATKQFHPDRFVNPDAKAKANLIMKELNEAKDKNDYFLLKEIVQKYENTF